VSNERGSKQVAGKFKQNRVSFLHKVESYPVHTFFNQWALFSTTTHQGYVLSLNVPPNMYTELLGSLIGHSHYVYSSMPVLSDVVQMTNWRDAKITSCPLAYCHCIGLIISHMPPQELMD
jgi:hypothetical protein